MENKPLCVKLRRFGGCVNWQSAYRNQYTLLSGCPASAREVTGSRSEQAPGRPGLEPASPQVQPRTGDEVPRPHTTSWAAPIPKKLYCFKWQNGISFCGAPGMAEGDRGWGWDPPVTKIKGFYKKCYKPVSKENPREAGGGSREGGGKTAKEGGT